jgi:hypothetical protein
LTLQVAPATHALQGSVVLASPAVLPASRVVLPASPAVAPPSALLASAADEPVPESGTLPASLSELGFELPHADARIKKKQQVLRMWGLQYGPRAYLPPYRNRLLRSAGRLRINRISVQSNTHGNNEKPVRAYPVTLTVELAAQAIRKDPRELAWPDPEQLLREREPP